MTKILKVLKEGNFYLAEFDSTIFRPAGGGQPSDNGMIKNDKFFGELIEAVKKNGMVIHKIKTFDGELKEGDEVELILNQKRRDTLTRMHTGEHLLFRSMQNFIPDMRLEKVDLGEEDSKIILSCKDIDWNKIFKAEELANMIIAEDRKVIEHHYTKEQAEQLKDVRIKIERIKDEKVRVIEIEDFDKSACSGTHCHSTKEIGNILITSFNSTGNNTYEVRFTIEPIEMLFDLSRVSRELRQLLLTDDDKIVATVRNMKENNENLKKQLRELAKSSVEGPEHELVKGIKFYTKEFIGFEKEILIRKAAELANNKSIVAFINKTEKTTQLILMVSKDLEHDASQILSKITSRFNGKGGGKKDFAMGSFLGDAKDALAEIKRHL